MCIKQLGSGKITCFGVVRNALACLLDISITCMYFMHVYHKRYNVHIHSMWC